MNASELKRHVMGRGSHFFDRDTMRFFGDTMRNYGVRKATIATALGDVECWELYRRRPVKDGQKSSAFFAVDDYREIRT